MLTGLTGHGGEAEGAQSNQLPSTVCTVVRDRHSKCKTQARSILSRTRQPLHELQAAVLG